jgi:hypothetical protein
MYSEQVKSHFVDILFNKSLLLLLFIKDAVKSVLRISSAHNRGGGPADINIAQMLHLSNFFELKRTLVYINFQ